MRKSFIKSWFLPLYEKGEVPAKYKLEWPLYGAEVVYLRDSEYGVRTSPPSKVILEGMDIDEAFEHAHWFLDEWWTLNRVMFDLGAMPKAPGGIGMTQEAVISAAIEERKNRAVDRTRIRMFGTPESNFD